MLTREGRSFTGKWKEREEKEMVGDGDDMRQEESFLII